ncbi:MAG: hypothetical protein LBM04_04245 [Opitutaceae bacterium]|jgi:hypothetical protein|nr:hypothetical protein [Opitutaceae bacterium]
MDSEPISDMVNCNRISKPKPADAPRANMQATRPRLHVKNEIKWLSESELKAIDFTEKRNKWHVSHSELSVENQILTREQAVACLNENASFARFPNVGAEDAEYFYFSLLTDRNMPDDFSSGFSVKKNNGEIAQWWPESRGLNK